MRLCEVERMELPALFLKRMELLTGGSFAAQYEAPQARGLRINTLKASGGMLKNHYPKGLRLNR